VTSDLYAHQAVGVQRIKAQPEFWIGDEPGAGKTRQAIKAAQDLYLAGAVDHVVVVAPAQVFRTVWYDPGLGQIREYLDVPSMVREYRPKGRTWATPDAGPKALAWTVANYELVRKPERMAPLMRAAGPNTMLILDESLAVKSPTSQTTHAIYDLRQRCGRVLLLNGTEGGGDTPGDVYAQAKIMSPKILGCRHWYEFRARYAVMGGYRRLQNVRQPDGKWRKQWVPMEVERWVNIDDLWQRMAPYYLRRTKAECLDLPAKIPPVAIEVPLRASTWSLYKAMRADSMAYLRGGGLVTAQQAGVRGLRLAQLCSGFLGGVRALDDEGMPYGEPDTKEVGTEKQEALLEWFAGRLVADPNAKLLLWCRFRGEAERTARAFAEAFEGLAVGKLVGGQTRDERDAAVALLDPRTAPTGPVVLVGTETAGRFGLNLSAAYLVAHLSSGFSHIDRTQADDRPHRPGQVHHIEYFDFVATGPQGQRTLDHVVLRELRDKGNVAAWGAAEWLRALQEERVPW